MVLLYLQTRYKGGLEFLIHEAEDKVLFDSKEIIDSKTSTTRKEKPEEIRTSRIQHCFLNLRHQKGK